MVEQKTEPVLIKHGFHLVVIVGLIMLTTPFAMSMLETSHLSQYRIAFVGAVILILAYYMRPIAIVIVIRITEILEKRKEKVK